MLIRALQRNARLTNDELAEVAHRSPTSCLRRVRQLEQAGVIERYTAVINQQALGLHLNVFVTITLESQAEPALRRFEREISSMPEVMEAYLMTGTADYLLRIVAQDVEDLERIHSIRLTRLAGVARVNSSIALRQVARRDELP